MPTQRRPSVADGRTKRVQNGMGPLSRILANHGLKQKNSGLRLVKKKMSPAANTAAHPTAHGPDHRGFGRHRAHGAWQREFALGFEHARPGAHDHVPVGVGFARTIKRSSHLRPNRSQPFATATSSLVCFTGVISVFLKGP